MTPTPGFRALKADVFRALLEREFGYRALPRRGQGGHVILAADGYPQLTWGFGRRELSPLEVRRTLVKDVGLTLDEAKEVMKRA